MYSRPFMKKQNKMRILIHSSSIDEMLPLCSRRAKALLKYRNHRFLDFMRTPESIENKELQEIVEFEKKYNSDGSLHSIEIGREKPKAKHAFDYRREFIEYAGKIIYKKEKLKETEIKTIELASIQATLNRFDSLNIFVTGNDVLLRNRLWFESHFPGVVLNIMTIEEAVEVIDLLLKHNGNYPISNFLNTNKGYWYWLSFRTKVPFYHVTTKANPLERSILDAFAQRFVFLLMSIDQMGFQYYSGVNNDAMENMIYHFNYFITLMTGIFDSLALQTKSQYELVFEGSNIPSRTSLHNETGKDFLKAVRDRNPDLRKHIHNHVHFIKAIYLLRKRVLHREGLRQVGFEYRGEEGKWKANFIRIPKDFIFCLRQSGDKTEDYEPWTRFGVLEYDGDVFLEPYKFAKAAGLLLSRFCNRYLQLLEFTNFIEEKEKHEPKNDFIRDIRLFETDNLGL